MPALVAAIPALLIALLRIWMVSIIGRVFLTLGVGLFVYNVAAPELLGWVAGKFHALPEFVRLSAGAMGLDVFFTMIFSALAVKMTARVLRKIRGIVWRLHW